MFRAEWATQSVDAETLTANASNQNSIPEQLF